MKKLNELNQQERSDLIRYMANCIGAKIGTEGMEKQAMRFMQEFYKKMTADDVKKAFDYFAAGKIKCDVVTQINQKTCGRILHAYDQYTHRLRPNDIYEGPKISEEEKNQIVRDGIIAQWENFKRRNEFRYPDYQMKGLAHVYFDYLLDNGHDLDYLEYIEESREICKADLKGTRENASAFDIRSAKLALNKFEKDGSEKIVTVAKWLSFRQYVIDHIMDEKELRV